MALTPLRWIGMAIAGCLLMSLIVLEFVDSVDRQIYSYRRPIDSVEARLEAQASLHGNRASYFAGRYRILQILDSAKRVVAASPDTGAVRVFIDRAIAPQTRIVADSTIRRAVAAKPGSAPKAGIDVFVAYDTARFERGVRRNAAYEVDARYALPARPGDRCRVVVRVGIQLDGVLRTLRQQAAADQVLGPCAFYAAFGEPGPRIRAWLAGEGWRYTVDGSWNSSTPDPNAGIIRDDLIFEGPSRVLYWFPVKAMGVRCLRGDTSMCEGALFESFQAWRGARAVGDATAGFSLGNRQYVPTGLGNRGPMFLSDAVRAMGRERFQEFWASPDSMHIAFEKASGQPLSAWIRSWLTEKYGPLEAGPRLSRNALGTSALLIVLSLAVILWFALNRRYV